MDALAITLGHNSSAILIRDGRVICGYEEERFSAKKSDSSYPKQSIDELVARFGVKKDCETFVGHWFTDAQLPSIDNPSKYIDYDHLGRIVDLGGLHSLNADFTHHDSHAEAAQVFVGRSLTSYHLVVADGFGSFGECISIYEATPHRRKLIHRVRGYHLSLGLLYQYATAFMGMQMHNHEYKMLAYEAYIDTVLNPSDKAILVNKAMEYSKRLLESYYKVNLGGDYDPVTSLDALPNVRHSINQLLTDAMASVSHGYLSNERNDRIVVSFFVQTVVELTMTQLVALYKPVNLVVTGGLFYNVKLNMLLAQSLPKEGLFSATPLAGDQGAGLGVYNAHRGDLLYPRQLTIGHRDLHFVGGFSGLHFFKNESEAMDLMCKTLRTRGWFNLVRGGMEFGPRALCNTSTIAIPTPGVAAQINACNNRTNEMPFAPVVTRLQAAQLFTGGDRIVKSLEYMIMALPYRPGAHLQVQGAAHYYPAKNVYTGRPQILSSIDPLSTLLLEFGPLINTSFNYHGVPIVRSMEQVIHSHVCQYNTGFGSPTTIVITGDDV